MSKSKNCRMLPILKRAVDRSHPLVVCIRTTPPHKNRVLLCIILLTKEKKGIRPRDDNPSRAVCLEIPDGIRVLESFPTADKYKLDPIWFSTRLYGLG